MCCDRQGCQRDSTSCSSTQPVTTGAVVSTPEHPQGCRCPPRRAPEQQETSPDHCGCRWSQPAPGPPAQRGWRQQGPHRSPREGRSPSTPGVGAPRGSTALAARGGSSAVLAVPRGFALGGGQPSVPAGLGKRSFTLAYKSPGYFEAAAVRTQRAQNPSDLPGPRGCWRRNPCCLLPAGAARPARQPAPGALSVIGYAAAGEGIAAERPFRRSRASPRKVRQQPHPQALRPAGAVGTWALPAAPRLGSRSRSSCEGTCRPPCCSPQPKAVTGNSHRRPQA